MKKVKNILSIFFIVGLLSSCETNNIFDDLGTSDGNIVANVYMETIAPQQQAGITSNLEVQYWSLDDDFVYLGLWDYVTVYQVFEVTVAGVTFTVEEQDEFQDWEEYDEYSFNFANWRPEISAYFRTIQYQIDQQYDAVTLNSSDVSFSEFSEQFPEGFEDNMFEFFSNNLTRSVLNDLMIDNGVMTQQEFDSHYADSGFLTTEGQVAIVAGLNQIGTSTLIDGNYTLGNQYQITLAFRATNGTMASNEYRRSFTVF